MKKLVFMLVEMSKKDLNTTTVDAVFSSIDVAQTYVRKSYKNVRFDSDLVLETDDKIIYIKPVEFWGEI